MNRAAAAARLASARVVTWTGAAHADSGTSVRIGSGTRVGAAIACALVVFAVLHPTAASGLAETEIPAHEPAPCPPPAGKRSDAAILADRIAGRDSGRLLLDLAIRNELERELADALRLVRAAHPQVAGIHARERYRPSVLILGLEPPLLRRVQGMFDRAGGVVTLRTGDPALDALNAELGLRGAKSMGPLGVIFCLGPELNVVAAAAAYTNLDGVSYAEPETRLGDGPDLEAARVKGDWYLVFRDAWGDCPSGCLDEQFSFFVIAGESVTRADSGEAPFHLLMQDRRWED